MSRDFAIGDVSYSTYTKYISTQNRWRSMREENLHCGHGLLELGIETGAGHVIGSIGKRIKVIGSWGMKKLVRYLNKLNRDCCPEKSGRKT